MSIRKTIVYAFEADPNKKAIVWYTINDDRTITITDYTIMGISDAKYPKFSGDIRFVGASANGDGTLMSAIGLNMTNGATAISVTTGQANGEESSLGYLSADETFKTLKPCGIVAS